MFREKKNSNAGLCSFLAEKFLIRWISSLDYNHDIVRQNQHFSKKWVVLQFRIYSAIKSTIKLCEWKTFNDTLACPVVHHLISSQNIGQARGSERRHGVVPTAAPRLCISTLLSSMIFPVGRQVNLEVNHQRNHHCATDDPHQEPAYCKDLSMEFSKHRLSRENVTIRFQKTKQKLVQFAKQWDRIYLAWSSYCIYIKVAGARQQP